VFFLNTSEKAGGLANQAIGMIKQGIGSAVGSEKLEGEGAGQESKGRAQLAVEKAVAAADERESKIRKRAHRIWHQEGSPRGVHLVFWHQAEKEIDAEEAARKLSGPMGD
jgi:uncharacterized protein YjbJ (UPF0337 family)